MATLTQVPGLVGLSPAWRASCVVLCTAFPHDRAVWAHTRPGVSLDLSAASRDPARSQSDRTLLACAQSLVDDAVAVPLTQLAALPDGKLRLVLDALAIVRGGLPVD